MRYHRCGGVVRTTEEDGEEYRYCPTCEAYTFDLDAPFPRGTDRRANLVAWYADDIASPDAPYTDGVVALHLHHGRHDPAVELDNWGEDGPWLVGKWLGVTYMQGVTLGGLSPETLALAREQDDPDMLYHDGSNGWCLDIRIENGCLRFGSMFYGAFTVESK